MTETFDRCFSHEPHPSHTWFPLGDFSNQGLVCSGVVDLGPAVEPVKSRRINGQAKGKRGELAVVNYLKPWFPDARRTVRTGFRNAVTQADDEGDIDGTPGLCLQVKVLGDELVPGKVLDRVFAETVTQASGRLPLIVNSRPGRASVGQWWVWLRVGDLVHLKVGAPPYVVNGWQTLVRVPMFNVISDLKSFSDRLVTPR